LLGNHSYYEWNLQEQKIITGHDKHGQPDAASWFVPILEKP
jgi:hypothetical protein